MIQKEVAVRLAEPPGSKEYGILSVLLQAWYDIAVPVHQGQAYGVPAGAGFASY